MTTEGCAHHWIIEAAHGALSNGKCKLCGEARQFANSTEFYDSMWAPHRPQNRSKPKPDA